MMRKRSPVQTRRRLGASSLELILVWAVAFPLVGIFVTYGIRIIRSVYELICVWVSWPFL